MEWRKNIKIRTKNKTYHQVPVNKIDTLAIYKPYFPINNHHIYTLKKSDLRAKNYYRFRRISKVHDAEAHFC